MTLGLRHRFRRLGDFVRRRAELVQTRGTGRSCPMCGWTGAKFLPFGVPQRRRAEAKCPRCGSLERHRLAYLLLKDELGPGQRTLHVAPEPIVERWLQGISSDYLSIDLDGARAMTAMDLTDLTLEPQSRTLVYCSHVLEHIPDDAAAIREMRRVLAPGGIAVVQTPVEGATTDEDVSVVDEHERLARFGQHDHVRFYGMDIVERLSRGGFEVTTLDADDLPRATVAEHALGSRQIFLCRAV